MTEKITLELTKEEFYALDRNIMMIEETESILEKIKEGYKQLEEQDPEMLLLRQGKVDFVDYDKKKYIRIEYTDSFADGYNWYVRRVGEDAIRPVRDVNVYASLEELYQKEVMKQKDDYPYKKYTPEETEQSLKEAFREAVKQGVVSSVENPKTLFDVIQGLGYSHDCCYEIVDAVEEFLLRKEQGENDKNFKNSLDLIREWGEKNKPPNLKELLWEWWEDIFTADSDLDADASIDSLVDRIEEFLPKEHHTNSYKWNECIKMIKSKLR